MHAARTFRPDILLRNGWRVAERREKGEGRREKGEGRRVKGEGRRVRGEG
jgi:hypothetical protein